MSKVIVVYDSKTGFTEQMAKAVVEGVKGVEGVNVELFKVGTPFSISQLNSADALIFGSPTIYGSTTPEMNTFIEALKEHKKSKRLKLSGKIGGVFGSYGWDGGWIVDMLTKELKALEIKIAAPAVSLVHGMYEKVQLDNESIKKCRELGRVIAKKC